MDIKKAIWLYVLIAVLVVALCSVFLSQIGGKSAGRAPHRSGAVHRTPYGGHETEAIAEQNKKLAEQDKRFAWQDKRLIELERIAKKIDEIQSQLNTRKVDIKDDDMSLIQEMIEKQVKLNVRSGAGPKIGVVSVQKIFQGCKRSAKYREEAVAEQSKVVAELEKLSKEIEAEKAGLKTLKSGSSDYMARVKGILEKQGSLQAQEEFHNQQMGLKEQRMIESLFKDVLQTISVVARERGLELVLEKSEPELPAPNTNELARTIGAHKVLYNAGEMDITDEVISILDARYSMLARPKRESSIEKQESGIEK